MKFALIGHPVAGSLSPALFAAAYGGRHTYDLVDRENFADAWQVFLNEYDGINVTAPFKTDAFAKAALYSPEAMESGAVNLVVKTKLGLLGHNADVDGVIRAVREAHVTPGDALVVGTGGAARAALVGARRLGFNLLVTGRSSEKVDALAQKFGAAGLSFADCAALRPALVIYTIPGGVPVPEGLNFAESAVLEANYRNPSLEAVPCKKYITGKRWLLWQAATGYEFFTREEPDINKLFNAI